MCNILFRFEGVSLKSWPLIDCHLNLVVDVDEWREPVGTCVVLSVEWPLVKCTFGLVLEVETLEDSWRIVWRFNEARCLRKMNSVWFIGFMKRNMMYGQWLQSQPS